MNGACVRADGGLDVAQLGRQVAQHLIAQQQRDLAQQRAELRRRRGLVAHQRQLVRHQRVVDDDGAAHSVALHDVLVPQLRLLADEARHQGDALGIVGDDHLDAALAQQTGIAGKVLVLADDRRAGCRTGGWCRCTSCRARARCRASCGGRTSAGRPCAGSPSRRGRWGRPAAPADCGRARPAAHPPPARCRWGSRPRRSRPWPPRRPCAERRHRRRSIGALRDPLPVQPLHR